MPKVGKKKFPYTPKGFMEAVKESGKQRRTKRAYRRIEKEASRDAATLKYANDRKGAQVGEDQSDPLFRAVVSNVGANERSKQRSKDLDYLNSGKDPKKAKKRFRRYKFNQ